MPSVPDPEHVKPWYLRNITEALALDEATGNVYVRTGFTGNIVISGNVNVPGNIDAHVIELGNVDISGNTLPVTVTSGNINAVVSGNVGITGNANVVIQGTPNVNANVSGNVGIIGNVNVTQGTDPWKISGNVNANVSGNVGVTGNVNIGTMPPITGNVGITGNANVILASDANVVISGFSGATSDAFGRLRVSEPYTIFDTQARYFDHNQFATYTNGTANVVYVQNQSSYQLNVGTQANDSVIRESTKVFPYQPGKSQLTLNTFCFNTPKTNLRQRVGLFGANDGVYFENDGTYNYFVIRSGSTGVEERVRQDAWNVDRLNPSYGNNPSGITLHVDRTQIMFADVEWLGVGSVRVGFVIDGAYIICHQFNHANQPGNTKVYMTTATLPIRYEITNTGITANSSMMTQICSSVVSEGGFVLKGTPASIGHNLSTPVRLPNDQSFKPLIAIRLRSSYPDAVILPVTFTISPVSQSNFKYRIYRKAATSGGTWANVSSTSPVEYNLNPTSISSGEIGDESFIISSNQSSAAPSNLSFGFEYQLERDPFNNVFYEYVISAATNGTNQDVYASIGWQEVS